MAHESKVKWPALPPRPPEVEKWLESESKEYVNANVPEGLMYPVRKSKTNEYVMCSGNKMLEQSIRWFDMPVATRLICSGRFDLNAKDPKIGKTPLNWLCFRMPETEEKFEKRIHLITLLCESCDSQDIDTETIDCEGRKPIDNALFGLNLLLAYRDLFKKKVDIDLEMHHTAHIIHVLLRWGASIDTVPQDYAWVFATLQDMRDEYTQELQRFAKSLPYEGLDELMEIVPDFLCERNTEEYLKEFRYNEADLLNELD